MKKKVIFIFFLIFLSTSLRADFHKDLERNFLKSLGYAAATAANIPAKEVITVANSLYNGDFKTAFITIASYASDEALNLIPLYGVTNFAKSLIESFGNVLITYIQNEVIEIAWKKFMQLDDTDKNNWLNGGYEPTIDEIKGIRYVDVGQMRDMFSKAWKNYQEYVKNSKKYLEAIKKISKILYYADVKNKPELFSHSNGATINMNTSIEIWKSNNNYFKFTLILPDGSTFVKQIKDPSDPSKTKTLKIKLLDIGKIEWEKFNKDYPDSVPVTLKINATVYDSTGLMKQLMPEMISPGGIVKRGDPIITENVFNFKVKPEKISCNGTLKGYIYFDYKTYVNGKIVDDKISASTYIEPSKFNFNCFPGKSANLDIDGTVLNGNCDEKGNGNFAINNVDGTDLNYFISFSCNPLILKLTSSGTAHSSDSYSIVDDEGNEIVYNIDYYLSNIKGTFY